MPGTILTTYHELSHLILKTILRSKNSHFSHKETDLEKSNNLPRGHTVFRAVNTQNWFKNNKTLNHYQTSSEYIQ